MHTRLLSRFAWGTLTFNVVVILMGAVVRATGSGAGCGRSWPTCRGQALPALEGDTAVEFAHRALSGIALLLVAILALWVIRRVPRPHQARTAAVVSLVAIVGEALIGAVIVLFEWVAEDASVARAVSVPLHLVNTFLLLAALAVTAHLLGGGGPLRPSRYPVTRRWMAMGAAAFVLIAATGAVTALADTLFPKAGTEPGVEHFLTDLRVIHPIIATLVVLAAAFGLVHRGIGGKEVNWLSILVGIQFVSGISMVFLGLPLWIRVFHLAIADLMWVGYVLAAARLMTEPSVTTAGRSRGASVDA